jgi:hypothetical protein
MYIVSFDGSPNDPKHKLFRNELIPSGQPTFSNIAPSLGLDKIIRSRAASWGDFDNDGDLDLFIPTYETPAPNVFYRNNLMETGQATFTDVAAALDLQGRAPHQQRAPLWVDYDGDGFLDLWINGERSIGWGLYHNGRNSNNWTEFKLVGAGPPTGSSRDGIGARVRIVAGNLKQIRETNGGMETWSQAPLIVHFGLGNRTKIDSVIIRWPKGTVDVMTNVPINRLLTIREGRGIVSVPGGETKAPQQYALFQNYPNPFNPKTIINYELAMKNYVTLKVFDVLGRAMITLVDGVREPGHYSIEFDGSSLPSGVYFYRLSVFPISPFALSPAPFATETKKMILQK